MSRWLIPLLLAGSLSLFAQYNGGGVMLPGGVRIPIGGTYPGGQYPGNGQTCPGGQYPVNGQCPGGQYPGSTYPNSRPGMSQVFYGNLRQISYSNLVIETDDSRIIQMQVSPNARFYSNFGSARMTDFDPGDYVNVQATQDRNGYYFANTITQSRKGTPAERTAAEQPLNVSMHSGNNQNTQTTTQNSDDTSGPVLRRAPDSGSSSASGAAGSSDASSSGSGNGSGSASDTPTLQRPAASQGDYSPSAEIAPMAGDPGPPVMRRGSPSPDASESASSASADSVAARPTVRSQDVNGVTQLPAEPAPVPSDTMRNTEGLPQPSGISATDDPIIDKARDTAFAFTETLPNYVVKQFTTRYQSDAANRGNTSWQPLDIVTTDVVAEGGAETYKNVMVNGKLTKDVDKTGSWSEGEFASTLEAILSPASNASFTNKRSTTIVNRPAYHYDYAIEQPRSGWEVYAGGEKVYPAYGGSIWIDKETSRVLRIEMAARNLPTDFPLDQVESTVDYDFVMIGDKKFLLPTHSEALSCMRGTSECTRNVIEFRNYKKFGADESITFDDSPAAKQSDAK